MCVCVFWCHGVYREMNRHSREISETVPAHKRAHTHRQITRTPLSCGGDECDADSLSLRILICIHRLRMHVCLFAFLSIPVSLLPNSDSLSLPIQSYISTCVLMCVCMYRFVLSLFVWWVCLTAGCLTLCFSLIQASLFAEQPVVGPANGHFCRAFIASVSVRVSCRWVLRHCAWVKVLIFYHYLTCVGLCF